MLPILFSFAGITIYTFGIFLVLAFFWSTYLLWKLVQLTPYREEDVFDTMFVALFVGLVVSRMIYVIGHFGDFGLQPLRILLVNGYPGMSLHGLLVGFLGMFAYVARRKKMKAREMLDLLSPALLTGLAVGSLGSFFGGIQLGSRTSFPLAVTYMGHNGLRHVAGLYEAVAFGAAALIAYRILFSIRRETYPRGAGLVFFGFSTALILTGTNLLLEQPALIAGYSFEAILSILFLLTFLVLFLYYFKNLFYLFFASAKSRIQKNGTKH